MDLLVPVVLAAIILATLIIYRNVVARRTNKQRSVEMVGRQQAIQAAIDTLGLKLKDSSTSVRDGDDAMQAALARLHELSMKGDLSELIADTEEFFKEWRASRVSA